MKSFGTLAIMGCLMLAGCQASEVQPIPGSITYGGQPRSKLVKSPVGSTVPHEFYDKFGNFVQETYIVQPDRSLKLVRQDIGQEPDSNR